MDGEPFHEIMGVRRGGVMGKWAQKRVYVEGGFLEVYPEGSAEDMPETSHRIEDVEDVNFDEVKVECCVTFQGGQKVRVRSEEDVVHMFMDALQVPSIAQVRKPKLIMNSKLKSRDYLQDDRPEPESELISSGCIMPHMSVHERLHATAKQREQQLNEKRQKQEEEEERRIQQDMAEWQKLKRMKAKEQYSREDRSFLQRTADFETQKQANLSKRQKELEREAEMSIANNRVGNLPTHRHIYDPDRVSASDRKFHDAYDRWKEKHDKAPLVDHVRNILRKDEESKQAWIDYCDNYLDNIKDPNRHQPADLINFIHWLNDPGAGAKGGCRRGSRGGSFKGSGKGNDWGGPVNTDVHERLYAAAKEREQLLKRRRQMQEEEEERRIREDIAEIDLAKLTGRAKEQFNPEVFGLWSEQAAREHEERERQAQKKAQDLHKSKRDAMAEVARAREKAVDAKETEAAKNRIKVAKLKIPKIESKLKALANEERPKAATSEERTKAAEDREKLEEELARLRDELACAQEMVQRATEQENMQRKAKVASYRNQSPDICRPTQSTHAKKNEKKDKGSKPEAPPDAMDLVDVSSLKRIAKDDLGLMSQPSKPLYKGALVQIYVTDAPYGGSDKSSNGHRYDSIPFANGMIKNGMSCQLIHYVWQEHDRFFDVCKGFHFIIVRCNPGQIKADGGDQGKFDNGMRGLRKLGAQVWPSPDVMEFMGAKDALCKVKNLNIGLEDTLSFYEPGEFEAGFKKTMAFQPRVIKQNRGSSGEGIWIVKLKKASYCSSYGERSCEDDEMLLLMEANDNHMEEHTVSEFIEFCVNGRTEKSGNWTSKGQGKYLEGGKDAGGMLVDQRFCPRITDGELRYNMVCDALVGIIHKKPKAGGISAVGGTGSVYTYYGAEEEKFSNLTTKFLQHDLGQVMPSLGLADEPIPLWWTTDFILASPEGTPVEDEQWIVGEFNCSCVGISKCLAASCTDDTPQACYSDINKEDLEDADGYGNIMGQKAFGILRQADKRGGQVEEVDKRGGPVEEADERDGLIDVCSLKRVAKDYMGLMDQPPDPIFKGALVQIYVNSQDYGGSDKSSNGHRYDSIPFANGMIRAGMSCQLIHYVHQEHAVFFEVCKNFDFIIVRCNPGQIKADGGDQGKFDEGMRSLRKLGVQVWPSPDVMELMGAKDALCKVAKLNIGLEDTLSFYEPEAFAAGFKQTMAFQPRVIKQNRGSSGEGIWIIKLKEGNYCSKYGERSCEDDELLDLMEANDNHSEEHTVAEFIEFCVNGRTDKSGEWTSKGNGKYLEGGKAEGGMLVDQRFCPRIVEGELRYNMVCDSLVGIIHKKPKEGGISAVGGTGSVYTYYEPQEEKFTNLTNNFLEQDLQKIMPALGLADEPIPLWWTTDFILASPEGTPPEEEKWIVGEFNCSCVGISKCLAAYCKEESPNACYSDISKEDLAEADSYGNLMGDKALGIMRQAFPDGKKRKAIPAGQYTGPSGQGTGPSRQGTGPSGQGTGPSGQGTGKAQKSRQGARSPRRAKKLLEELDEKAAKEEKELDDWRKVNKEDMERRQKLWGHGKKAKDVQRRQNMCEEDHAGKGEPQDDSLQIVTDPEEEVAAPASPKAAKSQMPAPLPVEASILRRISEKIQARTGVDTMYLEAPDKRKRALEMMVEPVRALYKTADMDSRSNGFDDLCKLPHHRLFRGVLQPEGKDANKFGRMPDAICQQSENLADLVEKAQFAQELLMEKLQEPWEPGKCIANLEGMPTALFAYNPGAMSTEEAEVKALVLYGPSEGVSAYRNLLDMARLTIVFPSCNILKMALDEVIDMFEVVKVHNYFKEPTALGARRVDVYVLIDLSQDSRVLEPYVCCLQLEALPYYEATAQASPKLEALYEKLCTSDIAKFIAQWTLCNAPEKKFGRDFRRKFDARYGSSLAGWRHAFGSRTRFLNFEHFRNACNHLSNVGGASCRDLAADYWADLDPGFGGRITYFDFDPEGAALLVKLRQRFMMMHGADEDVDENTLYQQMTCMITPELPLQWNCKEFRAIMRPFCLTPAEVDRVLLLLDQHGGKQHPLTVRIADIMFLVRLSDMFQVDAVLVSEEVQLASKVRSRSPERDEPSICSSPRRAANSRAASPRAASPLERRSRSGGLALPGYDGDMAADRTWANTSPRSSVSELQVNGRTRVLSSASELSTAYRSGGPGSVART